MIRADYIFHLDDIYRIPMGIRARLDNSSELDAAVLAVAEPTFPDAQPTKFCQRLEDIAFGWKFPVQELPQA